MKRFLLSLVSAETLETSGLWLIIVGLIGEAILIFSWSPHAWEKPLSFIFTVVIAFGVWVENVGASDLSSEKDVRIAEAEARADEAKRAAAEATLAAEKERHERVKLEQKFAWRRLDATQGNTVLTIAKQFSGQIYELVISTDPEALFFAEIVDQILSAAGWKRAQPYGPILTFHSRATAGAGVGPLAFILAPSSEGGPLARVTTSLATAFRSVGIDAMAARDPQMERKPATVQVVIQSKPM